MFVCPLLEGNFNWRFVFPFDYLAPEQCIVRKHKANRFSIDQTIVPPHFPLPPSSPVEELRC